MAVNSGLPHRGAFSYAVPDGMSLDSGDAVFVPFGQRTLQGVVVASVETPAVAEPRQIEAKLGERPTIAAERVKLACWIADYYLSPLFSAIALMLPPGFERKPLTFYEALLAPEEVDRTPLPPRQKLVLTTLIELGLTEAAALEKQAEVSGVATALSQLVQRGLVRRTYGLARPSVQAKTVPYVEILHRPAAGRGRGSGTRTRPQAAAGGRPAAPLPGRSRAGVLPSGPLRHRASRP